MRVMLDTCTLLWWWSEPDQLSPRARAIVRDPGTSIFLSAASAWEIATKYRIGKFPDGGRIIKEWDHRIVVDRFQQLPITHIHAFRAGTLLGSHKDPFDRMMAAQSMLENLPVITPDGQIEALGAERIW